MSNFPKLDDLLRRSPSALKAAAAAAGVPTPQFDALAMFCDGKSYREIADATGKAHGTVRSRINRARTLIERKLEAAEGNGPERVRA